jgi:hypothetical protein
MPFKEKISEPIKESRLRKDSPSVKFDDCYEDKSDEDRPIPPKKVTPIKKMISPSELNLKLRSLYAIPFSVSRYKIDPYLTKIENANHKFFLKRYAINGKEFDVCWILLQEGI